MIFHLFFKDIFLQKVIIFLFLLPLILMFTHDCLPEIVKILSLSSVYFTFLDILLNNLLLPLSLMLGVILNVEYDRNKTKKKIIYF